MEISDWVGIGIVALVASGPLIPLLWHMREKLRCSRGHVFRRKDAYAEVHCSGMGTDRFCPKCFDEHKEKNCVEADVVA